MQVIIYAPKPRSIARKEIDAAAAQVVDLSLEYGLVDYSIVRVNIPDSNGVRGLRTFRDLKKHGEVQGNCMGDQSVLLQAARGEKLFFEVDVDNRTYSVSMPIGTPWQVDLVESTIHCEPPEYHRQRIASMVEAAVLKAVSRRKVI